MNQEFVEEEFYREVLCIIENELTYAFQSFDEFIQSMNNKPTRATTDKLNDLEQCTKLCASENVANLREMCSSLGVFQGPFVYPSNTINTPLPNNQLTSFKNQYSKLSSITSALEAEIKPLERNTQVLFSAFNVEKLTTNLDRYAKLLTKLQDEIHDANIQTHQYTSGLHIPIPQAIQALKHLDQNLT